MENNENLNNQVNESNNVEQEKKNNSKTIGIVVLVIGLLLVCFAGYKLFIEKPEPDKPKDDNTQEQGNNKNDDNGTQENEKYKAYNFDEVVANMKRNIRFEYEITSGELPRELDITPADEKYHVVLSSDGKVNIRKGESDSVTLSISDVKNIDYCNDMYVRVFILLNNGDVYEYTLEDFDDGKYVPTKINEIKNATKFVKLDWADCTECGGNVNLGIIDNNNMYIELDSVGF